MYCYAIYVYAIYQPTEEKTMNHMMKNECWNVPTCHDAGKGDKPRPQNARAYRSGYDAIDWSKRPRIPASHVHAPNETCPCEWCSAWRTKSTAQK